MTQRLIFDRVFELPKEFNEETRVCLLQGNEGEYDMLILSHPNYAASVLNMTTGEIVELDTYSSPE